MTAPDALQSAIAALDAAAADVRRAAADLLAEHAALTAEVARLTPAPPPPEPEPQPPPPVVPPVILTSQREVRTQADLVAALSTDPAFFKLILKNDLQLAFQTGKVPMVVSKNATGFEIDGQGHVITGGGLELQGAQKFSMHDLSIRAGAGVTWKIAYDALTLWGKDRPVEDGEIYRCNFAWASDENLGWQTAVRRLSLHDCFIYDGLMQGQKEQPHNMGMLVGEEGGPNADIVLERNLFAFNHARNPRIGCGGRLALINNVLLGAEDVPWFTRAEALEYVGNYYWFIGRTSVDRLRLDDNHGKATIPRSFVYADNLWVGGATRKPLAAQYTPPFPFSAPSYPHLTALGAYAEVLANSGNRADPDNARLFAKIAAPKRGMYLNEAPL